MIDVLGVTKGHGV